MAPIFRRMAAEPRLDLHVTSCFLRGAEAAADQDFATSVKWDVPLLQGYSWTAIPNTGSGQESRRRLARLSRIGFAVISVPPARALPCYAEMVPLLAILQAFLEMR
jgi:hypothetical protein